MQSPVTAWVEIRILLVKRKQTMKPPMIGPVCFFSHLLDDTRKRYWDERRYEFQNSYGDILSGPVAHWSLSRLKIRSHTLLLNLITFAWIGPGSVKNKSSESIGGNAYLLIHFSLKSSAFCNDCVTQLPCSSLKAGIEVSLTLLWSNWRLRWKITCPQQMMACLL